MGIVYKWTNKQKKAIIKSAKNNKFNYSPNKVASRIARRLFAVKMIDSGEYIVVSKRKIDSNKHILITPHGVSRTIIKVILKNNP